MDAISVVIAELLWIPQATAFQNLTSWPWLWSRHW